jgi:hypothetical protein
MNCAVCCDMEAGTCRCDGGPECDPALRDDEEDEPAPPIYSVQYWSEAREVWLQPDPYHPGFELREDAEHFAKYTRRLMPNHPVRVISHKQLEEEFRE